MRLPQEQKASGQKALTLTRAVGNPGPNACFQRALPLRKVAGGLGLGALPKWGHLEVENLEEVHHQGWFEHVVSQHGNLA